MIYHLTQKKNWEEALTRGFYDAPSLYSEGFIHCSEKDQVQASLDRYFKNLSEILVLSIDENRLQSKLQYDFSNSVNQNFPHIYGPLNIDAVVDVQMIKF